MSEETKRCSKCKETKPVSEFYRRGATGYQSMCKACKKTKPVKTIEKPVEPTMELPKEEPKAIPQVKPKEAPAL